MNNPCITCSDIGGHCYGLCRDKMRYINSQKDKPTNTLPKQLRTCTHPYVMVDINKNGIRREINANKR